MHVLLLADPADRRTQALQQALRDAGHTSTVYPWTTFVEDPHALEPLLGSVDGVHIESPGEYRQAWADLVRVGRDPGDVRPLPAASAISGSREWYTGFSYMLGLLDRAVRQSGVSWFGNKPAAIANCFDKKRTREILQGAGCAVPPGLDAVPDCGDDLLQALDDSPFRRVMVKPRHGSSAAGIIALRKHAKHGWLGRAAAEYDQGIFHNSLQLRDFHGRDLKALLACVLAEGVVVERWIPKRGIDSVNVDVRQVVHGTCSTHCVVRGGTGPFCNLHLGGKRISTDVFSTWRDGAVVRDRVRTLAIAAAQALECAYAGVDQLIEVNGRVWVAEVNAFGDLLPGITYTGLSAQEYAVAHLL